MAVTHSAPSLYSRVNRTQMCVFIPCFQRRASFVPHNWVLKALNLKWLPRYPFFGIFPQRTKRLRDAQRNAGLRPVKTNASAVDTSGVDGCAGNLSRRCTLYIMMRSLHRRGATLFYALHLLSAIRQVTDVLQLSGRWLAYSRAVKGVCPGVTASFVTNKKFFLQNLSSAF